MEIEKTLYQKYAYSQLHGLNSAFKYRPRAYQEIQAYAVTYVVMQNIGVVQATTCSYLDQS